MIVLEGKKSINISKEDFLNKISEYSSLCIDIGTGQGAFIYKKAKENPDVFCIGLDSAGDNITINRI